MSIRLVNKFGVVKDVELGFSWTNLLFGSLVPLFRGDFKWAVIQFFLALLTSGLSVFVFPFIYNKLYVKDLLREGFYPVTEHGKEILLANGLEVFDYYQ